MSFFHTSLLLPLAEPERNSGLARRLREIRRYERMPEKDQRAIQQQRLQRILQHAYDTVPHYRKRFDDAGFRPSDARIDRPLPLPALCRDDLREGENRFARMPIHSRTFARPAAAAPPVLRSSSIATLKACETKPQFSGS